jgi:hypothetical protein
MKGNAVRLKGPFRKIFGMSKGDHGDRAAIDGGLDYDVTFVHQNHVNLCGDASAQMLLLFNERGPSASLKRNEGHATLSYRMQRNPRGVLEGGGDGPMIATLRAAGLRAWDICPQVGRWTGDLVMSCLRTYGPYAQTVQFSVATHWVVVIGTDRHKVYYHDPWRGSNMSKTIADWIVAADDNPGSAVAATEDYVAAPPGIQLS